VVILFVMPDHQAGRERQHRRPGSSRAEGTDGRRHMTSDPLATPEPASTVAVLGTGIMGSAMARNLVAAGLRTTVWDRSPQATAPLAAAGAAVAGSAQDATRDAQVVITMLPTANAVESVIFGPCPPAFARGAVWAQMGTIGVAETIGLANRLSLARPDVLFMDAPVSGSKGPAEAGQLLILASGPAEAEALELGRRLGIDPAGLDAVLEGGPLDAPLADAKLHKIARGDFAPEFPLEWALKDVDLAIAAADGAKLPMLEALSVQWHAAVAAGYGRDDVSAARLALGDPARAGG
jgi:3-hydroxyisobutyrate dehydrogenase